MLTAAAALVVALASLSAFLLLGSPGRGGEPSHPVAVTSPQSSPASTRPSTAPSPSSAAPSTSSTDDGGSGSDSGSGGGSGGGNDPGAAASPTDGTVPGIGATMPSFPGH